MRTSALILLLLLPLASAQAWDAPRDQLWSGKGPGVPDLWVPHDLVQGETARIGIIEWPGEAATVRVLDGERVLYEESDTMSSYGTGHYGEVFWIVPRDLAPGNYTVVGEGSGARVQDIARVYAAPHLFLGPRPTKPFDVVPVEAVGFDAAPVMAVVVQGPHRWTASWSDARGAPMERGASPPEVSVPGAAIPQRVLGATDGHESVHLAPVVLGPGALYLNGTRDGAPASLSVSWDVPAVTTPEVWLPFDAFANETLVVTGAGFGERVRVGLGEAGTEVSTDAGFFQTTLVPVREGNVTLVVDDGASRVERPLVVHAPPQDAPSAGHAASLLPAPGVAAVLVAAAATATLALRRRA